MSLVNTKDLFKNAYKNHFAIGAFNVNNMEIIQGVMAACKETESPVILQVSKGAREYANSTYLVKLVEAAVIENKNIPIVLHLDHGQNFQICKDCIDSGFTSVMIDGSSLPFEKNIEITKQVTDYAHKKNVVVEAELGVLAGIEDEVNVSNENANYTDPKKVEEFVYKTNCDSLAIAIGTSHGAYKFKKETNIQLRFDILEEISKILPEFPLVLHGSSSIPENLITQINKYGGNIIDAIGVPEDQLRKAAQMAVCKINIDSDIRLAMTSSIRKHMFNYPDHFDPRQYLKDARNCITELVKHKILNVLGSNNKIY